MIFVHVTLLVFTSSFGLKQLAELNNHFQKAFEVVTDLIMVAALKRHPWMYCSSKLVRFTSYFCSLRMVALESHPWILMLELTDNV